VADQPERNRERDEHQEKVQRCCDQKVLTRLTKRLKRVKEIDGRRGFLRGAGFTAAGATVLDRAELIAKEASRNSAAVGPGRVPLVLNVNGKDYHLALEPRTTLGDALRYDLGLTGTKIVCDRGACSGPPESDQRLGWIHDEVCTGKRVDCNPELRVQEMDPTSFLVGGPQISAERRCGS
jgi:hypothetical protein